MNSISNTASSSIRSDVTNGSSTVDQSSSQSNNMISENKMESNAMKTEQADDENDDAELVIDESVLLGDDEEVAARPVKKVTKSRPGSSSDDKSTALDRLNELLAQTEQFASYVRSKSDGKPTDGSARITDAQKREKEEDERLVAEEEEEEEHGHVIRLDRQPATIKAEMRDYQLEALNWLIRLHDQTINGILADEMGLGKTLMSLSLLSYLKLHRGYAGPHLVIVPKSTSSNWVREVLRWTSNLTVTKFHGNAAEREEQKKTLAQSDVTITTYEMCILEKSILRKINWHYIYIDEAHRIKNENSLLSQVVRSFKSEHRLLITGTPLQNSLHELWALLNFLVPSMFNSSADFESWFNLDADTDKQAMIQRLHRILRPFLLRRLKSDVESTLLPKIETNLYVGLSSLQRQWYTKLLSRDLEVLNGLGNSKVRLLNIVMQLRKVANHPYLFTGAEPGPPYVEGEHLVENSGKMVLLDKLLARLKSDGNRVLIFSQMTRLLDILEDFCRLRGYNYCRIDGQTKQEDRDDSMDAFNAPNSDKFIFLLSTRAGGLGINLQTADTVILYDSDWNPQMDLQAQDRAHRIGQKRQVRVFRFVTEGTIEEKIVERAMKKLFLDALVIKEGRLTDSEKQLNANELAEMVRFGASRIFQSTDSTISDEDIDTILAKGVAQTEAEQAKLKELKGAGFDLASFSLTGDNSSTLQFEGVDYSGARRGKKGFEFVSLPQRQRKENYNESAYFREALRVGEAKPRGAKREFRPSARWDFQLFDSDRLEQLERKEFDADVKFRELKQKKLDQEKERKRMQQEKEKEDRRAKRKEDLAKRAHEAAERGVPLTQAETEAAEKEAMSDDEQESQSSNQNTAAPTQNNSQSSSSALTVPSPSPSPGSDTFTERSSRSRTKLLSPSPPPPSAPAEPIDENPADEDAALLAEAGGLTKAELAEKEALLSAGFGDWMRRHYDAFMKACEKYGRDAIGAIAESGLIEGKTPKEIRAYHRAFWHEGRGAAMKDYDKLMQRLDRADARREKIDSIQALIEAKVKRHRKPLETMTVPYSGPQKNWTIEEDRGLLLAVNECGYGEWDAVKAALRASWMFRFDWFLKTRTATELQKRCDILIKLIEKENAEIEATKKEKARELAAKNKAAKRKAPEKASTTKAKPASAKKGAAASASMKATTPAAKKQRKK